MHGEKEVKEQLNQYCIRREQKKKLLPYLRCFLENGDGEACLKSEEIDMAKLESCKKEADKEFKITANLEDKTSWAGGRYPQFLTDDSLNKKYTVQGSRSEERRVG